MKSRERGSKKVNVLHIIERLSVGGAENLLLVLARNIDRERFNLSFCCIKDGGYIADRLREEGFKVVSLETYRLRHSFKRLSGIARLIKDDDIDIVQTHLVVANLWGRLAALFSRKAKVCKTEHAILRDVWTSGTFKERKYFFIDNLLDSFSDRIVYVSEAVKKAVLNGRASDPAKHIVIYNAFDEKHFNIEKSRESVRSELGYSKDDIVIGIVARLVAHKGHRFLFEALREVKKRHGEIKLLVVGNGPEKSALEKMAASCELHANFLTDRDDVPELMRAMDIFVLPSLREPFGITVLEALYSGLPVIGTNAGGIAEIIEDGETGLLVPPAGPEAIEKALLTLIENPSIAEGLARRGREVVLTRFSGVRYAEQTQRLYTSLANKNRGESFGN
ncbi:MAG: glycosyltransferase [Thermodesulfobacteriota bacterium]